VTVDGGAGIDEIYGGGGNDTLRGGDGDDRMPSSAAPKDLSMTVAAVPEPSSTVLACLTVLTIIFPRWRSRATGILQEMAGPSALVFSP